MKSWNDMAKSVEKGAQSITDKTEQAPEKFGSL